MPCVCIAAHDVVVLCLAISVQIAGVMSTVCVVKQNNNSGITDSNDKLLTSTYCQWGCCDNSIPPCCSVPINLMVGAILGGVLIVTLVTTCACYYCVYRRNEPCLNFFRRLYTRQPSSRSPATTQPEAVMYYSETSASFVSGSHPRYSDAPPSYEEVMKGQMNHAFKPETSVGESQQER